MQEIPGVRVKIRTERRGGRNIATATIWRDGKSLREMATLDLELFEGPGDPNFQSWVDTVSTAFGAWMSRRTSIPGIKMKRKRSSYRGEPS